jgi:DNA modification methylase
VSSFTILEGDCTEVLATLEPESVQTCITSPPYWGLRDYGTATWLGGDPDCDHLGPPKASSKSGLKNDGRPEPGRKGYELEARVPFGGECGKCGALREDYQLGLEDTPEEYVAKLVKVFQGVRRVLREDGTLWLNLGDSYARAAGDDATRGTPNTGQRRAMEAGADRSGMGTNRPPPGIKAKDLIGIPWMVAFALRADGWYLRSDIIWHKPNPMPESVTDRPTKSHEYLFLLTKSARYLYDHEAIKEPATYDRPNGKVRSPYGQGFSREDELPKSERMGEATVKGGDRWSGFNESGRGKQGLDRNKRSVWSVNTQPFTDAHFATFPPLLIEPCILAGSLAEGAMIEPEMIETPSNGHAHREGRSDPSLQVGRAGMSRPRQEDEGTVPMTRAEQAGYAAQLRAMRDGTPADLERFLEMTLAAGGESTMAHYVRADRAGARPIPPELLERWIEAGWLAREVPPAAAAADPATSVVLDPFSGAGTTGLVALRHNRRYIGIELNPEYAQMARHRILDDAPLLNHEEEVAA